MYILFSSSPRIHIASGKTRAVPAIESISKTLYSIKLGEGVALGVVDIDHQIHLVVSSAHPVCIMSQTSSSMLHCYLLAIDVLRQLQLRQTLDYHLKIYKTNNNNKEPSSGALSNFKKKARASAIPDDSSDYDAVSSYVDLVKQTCLDVRK